MRGAVVGVRPVLAGPKSLANRLLGGCARIALLTLPAAVSLGITLPDEAQAQAFSVSNYSNIGPGSGLYYTSANPTLFGGSSGAPWSVTNLGTVVNSGSGSAISLFSGTISNGGLIKSIGGSALLISNGGGVTNTTSGVISGGSYGLHIGALGSGRSTVVNDGVISATVVGGSNSGIYLGGGGSVTNHASGSITGTTYGLRLFGTVTVSNAGTIIGTSNAGVYSEDGATIANSVGATISGGAEGILTNLGVVTVTNAGTITGTSSYGIYLGHGGSVTNSGTASKIAGRQDGVKTRTAVGTVTNEGTISATVEAGIYLTAGGTVTNSGTASTITGPVAGVGINGTGTVINEGTITGSAGYGVKLLSSGSVTNSGASARITGSQGGVFIGAAGTVNNSGTIAGSGGTGIGVRFSGGSADTLNNSGTITATSAGIRASSASGARITNSGVIRGTGASGVGIDLSSSATSTIDNSGTISGAGGTAIAFGSGSNELIVESGSSITGQVVGLSSATNAVVFNGTGTLSQNQFVNFSNVNFGNSASWTLGAGVVFNNAVGVGSGTVSNGGTINGAVTVGSTGTLANSGTVTNSAGGGVSLSGSGRVTNAGTITGTSAGISASGANGARITNSGVIRGTGASGVGIDLSAGANSTIDNSGTISGATAIKFGSGTNELIVESGSSITGNVVGLSTATNSVVFYGTGTLSQTQLVNFQSASFGNSASWTVGPGVEFNSAVGVGTGTVTNAGTINGAVTVGTNGTLANSGTVINSAGSGVFLGGSGMVTNTAGGLIQGSTYGAQLTAGGTIVNAGTILDDAIAGAALGTGSVLVNQSGGLVAGVTGVLMTGAATVFNAGTITGTGGTAVQLSAAGGTLTLQTGSLLNGAVDGGGGNGAVILQGSGSSNNVFTDFGTGSSLTMDGTAWTLGGAVAIANTTVESGALTVSGSLTGTSVAVQSGASLLGTGSIAAAVTNAGTLVPGGLGSVGTLTLTGSYTQSATGVLVVAADSSGNASLLKVNGTANLAGTVQMVPLGSGFANGTRYTIVTATGGINGTFSSVSSSSPLLAFSLSYDAADVYATLGQLGLSTVGGTRNQRATAAAFDLASAANSSAYAASLAALDTLSASGVRSALDRLSGEAYTGVATTALASGELFTGLIRRQSLAAASSDGASPGQSASGAGNRVQLASLASDWAYDPVPRIDKPWGMWVSGYGQTGGIASDGNAHRLNETMSGGVVGVDYKVNPQLRIGVAFGAGNTSFSLNNDGGRGSVDQTQAALYADYDWGAAYLDGQLGVAYGDGRVRRDLSLPGLPAVATGHATDTQALSSFEAGYRLDMPGHVTLTPFAGLSFDTVRQNGVTESGAGALGLTVKGRTTNSAKSQLGTRFDGTVPVAGTALATDLSIGWAHEYAPTARTATVAFSADPAASFQVDGARSKRDAAVLGAGLAAPLSTETSVYLRYDASLDGSSSSHAVSGGFRVTW